MAVTEEMRAGPATTRAPLIVGMGGTTRADSSSERALRFALDAAAQSGARTACVPAAELEFAMYAPERGPHRSDEARAFVDLVRRADGLLIATPGYHGGISGLVKNALDYLEDTRDDEAPYLHGRAVGCIVCAYGWQATATTLVALRSVVHALRGWPTPLGVAINSAEPVFSPGGEVAAPAAANLRLLGHQVVEFARMRTVAP
jgi:FMN reductase